MKLLTPCLLAMALASAFPAAAQQTSPISFARGATSATVSGNVQGNQYRDYTVRAAAGQRMRINLLTRNPSAYFNLLPPGSRDEAIHIGSSSGNSYNGLLDRTGAWTIRVYLMRSAARRGAVANYQLSVAVAGRPAPARPWDATVPGTGYNATAPVDCRFSPAGRFQQCNAGVRRLGNGNAVVEVDTGPGGRRRIEFRGGRPTTSDMGPVTYSVNNGIFEIRIAGETYRFADSLVFGG